MKFHEILPEFLKGKRIRRECWCDPEGYIYIKNGYMYNEKDLRNEPEDFFFDGEDFLADDWKLCDRKYFNFYSAYGLMRDGKMVRRKDWESNAKYLFLKPDGRFFGKYDEDYYAYTIHQEDLEAKDWYIVEEE